MMKYKITLLAISMLIMSNVEARYKKFLSGRYALSEIVNMFDKKTKKPKKLTIIETLDIDVKKNGDFIIIPLDDKSKYFGPAKGFMTDDSVEFGFTLIRDKTLFSVNYIGKVTDDGYIKGQLLVIYPNSKSLITGDWAMKMITEPKKCKARSYH